MPDLKPRKVKRTTGMNPIARAVARDNLRKAVTDQKIQLYLLAEGSPCVNILLPMLILMEAFILAVERDKDLSTDAREVRILRGAISACDQMITDNSYRQTNTTTLDVALDCAVELSKKVDPVLFNAAWNELSGGVM